MFNEEQRAELLNVFLVESSDLVQRIEQVLTELENDMANGEAVNELFRAVHTLKGSAGLLGLNLISDFAHVFEDVLMRVRDQEINLDAELVNLSFKCSDHLAALVEGLADSEGSAPEPERAAQLILALQHYQVPVPGEDLTVQEPPVERLERTWHISLRFPENLFRQGFDPASFLRYLGKLGSLEEVCLVSEALPLELEEFDPESCYFGLEIRLCTDCQKRAIADVFEFIADIAWIRILPPESVVQDYLELIRQLPETDERLGKILVDCGAVTEEELNAALGQQSGGGNGKKIGEYLIEQAAVDPLVVCEAVGKQKSRKPSESAFLRVSANKLDTLINQVGELVIASAGAQLMAGGRNDPELMQMCEDIQNHVEQIRESALQLRMVEIGESFNRFHRVVRETSESLEKRIRLDIQGAETELDKTLVDKIHDPLVHLVRNAIDHGIESPEERLAANKPAEGQVSLNAFYESGMIVIEVTDDGRGIDEERVHQKAVEAGVISAGDVLEKRDLLALVFHPGLSTAGKVSSLSGRGVGMDSVRQDIDALRGTIEIANHPGQGCRVSIRLPLTLAIIDGFLVSVADQYFVIPTEWVVECIEAPHSAEGGMSGSYIDLRGKPLPVTRLRERFNIGGQGARRQSLIVVSQGLDWAGLMVDALHGEIQTVIKPLGALFENLPDIAGGTILGSGQVALTLDVPSLLASMRDAETSPGRAA